MREREKSSTALNSHGNLHLGSDTQTPHKYKLGGYWGNRSDFKTEFEASNKGTWSDLVASSRFVYSPFSKFCFLILFIYVCRVKSR